MTDVWARWDSVWFLRIAEHGYASLERTAAAASIPLYPASSASLGRVFFGHYVLAGIADLAGGRPRRLRAALPARRDRLGAEGARRAVLYLAVFPMALFLQAVYSESLYLLLTLAAFIARRAQALATGRVVAGLALLTRPVAVRAPARARASRLALARPPAAPSAEPRRGPACCSASIRSPLVATRRPLGVRRRAGRSGPGTSRPPGRLAGIWDGLRAGWAGVRQLVIRLAHPRPTGRPSTEPTRCASPRSTSNVSRPSSSSSSHGHRLAPLRRALRPLRRSQPRDPAQRPERALAAALASRASGSSIFPLFLALAVVGGRPRAHTAIVSISSLLLGVAIVQWALWQWVA